MSYIYNSGGHKPPSTNTLHIMSKHLTNAVDHLIASQDVEAITATIERVEVMKAGAVASLANEPDEEQAVATARLVSGMTRGLARLRSALVC